MSREKVDQAAIVRRIRFIPTQVPAGGAVFTAAMLCSVLSGVTCADSRAQDYPVKLIRFIVPYEAGGGADITARMMATKLSESLGQRVVIDNRAGAAGNIGSELAARAAPDGYTLLLAAAQFATNVSLYSKIGFDPVKDFTAVTLLAKSPLIVVVHPSLPVRSIKDLIALAKSAPEKINYGSGGAGSGSHLATELFKTMAKVEMIHVPYKGGNAQNIAVLTGEVPITMGAPLSILPHVTSGRVKALAVTSLQRAAALADVPTVAEGGLPGFEGGQWYGVAVPAGTPNAVVARLHRELVLIVRLPEISERLVRDIVIPMGSTPDEFVNFVKNEIAKIAAIIKASKARVD